MSNIIIFDSDFIISNYKKLDRLKEKFNGYELFIPEICVNEIAIYRTNENMSKITDFQEKVPNLKSLGVKFSKTNEEMEEFINEEVKKYLITFFSNKIIEYKSYSIDDIISRAYKKIPPFSKSDEGFKDTLILLNIIDYLKENKYTNCYFITNDKVFINNRNAIQEEIKSKSEANLEIIDGNKSLDEIFDKFNVGNEKIIDEFSQEVEKDIDIKGIRNDLKNICFNLFNHVEINPFNGDDMYVNNFKITKMISKDEIKEFLDCLSVELEKCLFSTETYFSSFFDDPFLFCSKETKIDIECLEKINDIYLKIKHNSKYVQSLINLLYENFKMVYISYEEELPF